MSWAAFFGALLLTELVEGGLVLIYGRLRRYPLLPLLALVLLLNGVTQPLLSLALTWQGATSYWAILLPSELLIWLCEGLFLYAYLGAVREAWGVSLLLNGASFALGLVLPI